MALAAGLASSPLAAWPTQEVNNGISGDSVRPEFFGALGDGHSDDTIALQRAIDSGREIALTSGRSYLIRSIAISKDCVLAGNGAKLTQLILGTGNGAPLLAIKGDNVTVRDVSFVGRRREQPADGYSDSFDGGGRKTGRAYRAGIRVDGGESEIRHIVIANCDFREIYGACVAARQCRHLAVVSCRATDTNFELLMMSSPRPTSDIVFRNNELRNIGTGDKVVNANGVGIANASRIFVDGNRFQALERDAIKLEASCSDVVISDNSLDGNTSDNFAFVQVQSLGTNVAERIAILNNRASHVGAGFAFNTHLIRDVIVMGNVIEGTFGSSMGDGLQLGNGSMSNIVIAFNRFVGIRRYGLVIGPTTPVENLEGIAVFKNEISLEPHGGAVGLPILISMKGGEIAGAIAVVGNRVSGRLSPGSSAQQILIRKPESATGDAVFAAANSDLEGNRLEPAFVNIRAQS